MLARSASPPVHVLSPGGRRLVTRFSAGLTPKLTAQVHGAGGARAWWEVQLSPSRIDDPAGRAINGWFHDLAHRPSELWRRHEEDIAPGWQVMHDLARSTLMRRAYSSRQVLEVMTDFWSNLLHVPLGDDEAWVHRVAYDATIRRHALGRFDEMLVAAITHPSMGCYLDNAVSTKDSPNENLGRELLELHSVGVDAGYSERDVRHSARMLTGYRVDLWNTFRAYYDPGDHHTGRIEVLDFTHPNGRADGRAATRAYLRHLARHPATARRIAHRLCVRFVADDPPGALVRRVATVFERSGTDIRATLRALVDHPQFAEGARLKARTPVEDYVATIRALDVQARRPTREGAFANMALWQADSMGQTPYGWPAPNGSPEESAAWIGVGRILSSFDVHLALIGGWWPTEQVDYRGYRHWLPALPAPFATVIDHMSRLLLGRPAGDRLATAVSRRVEIGLRRRVTAEDLPEWRVFPMLQVMLDSPAHMTR